ncbi:MAG: hypothetical protein EP330_28385 [Deltaproteobacteria bacterium]|nr:MAG: hypothetical protein EP330_28385 [Deltaproteobacteria bacterium]
MPWWSPLDIPEGHERALQLGTLAVRVARRDNLYRLAWRHLDTPEPIDVHIGEATQTEDLGEGYEVLRIAARGSTLALSPRVAPRPIVARPDVPFTVSPQAEVRVYVNTPIWVSLRAERGLKLLPVVSVKPTWFGTNREGVPCFAMRTHLRLSESEVQRRPHRALAPVRIVNEGDDPLVVDRVRIPAPSLPIHADAEGQLWLPEIVLTRREGQEEARLSLGDRRKDPVLAEPSEPMADHAVVRAFNSIFR